MAHVNESDASAAADSTAFRVRASARAPLGVATAASAGWAPPSFGPAAPAYAPADGAVQPSSFEALSAR